MLAKDAFPYGLPKASEMRLRTVRHAAAKFSVSQSTSLRGSLTITGGSQRWAKCVSGFQKLEMDKQGADV